MDFFSLHCFLSVVETGSFTKAAKEVGRTQSAVTQQIGKLEKTLGKSLFIRGRQLRLTSEGELFFPYAQKLCTLSREAVDSIAKPELEGEISFGLPEDFATLFLSEILAGFSRLHPKIKLNVECDLTLNLFRRFKEKKLDIVLVKMTRPDDFPNGVDVWTEPLEWVASEKNAETVRRQAPLPLVLSPFPCVYRQLALEALGRAAIPSRAALTSPSYLGLVAAVEAGMGVTVLPRTLIPKTLIPIQDHQLPKLPDLHVSLLKQGQTSASLETLEQFLLKKLESTWV